MKIVGFVGPKGSGKDTAAMLLTQSRRIKGKISFAGPLKDICSKVFGLSVQVLNDPDLKERAFQTPIKLTKKHFRDIMRLCETYLPPVTSDGLILYRSTASIAGLEGREMKSPRELMQFIGTEYIRDRVYKEFHMRAAFSEAVLSKLEEGVYAVTDVRFANEHEFLKGKFGADFTCFYVDRPEAEERLAQATHPSELEVKKIREILPETQILKNHGSMDEFKALLKETELPKEDKTGAKKKRGFVFVENGKSRN
jgi:ABC-type oligopeptide transport system ATPase subunit